MTRPGWVVLAVLAVACDGNPGTDWDAPAVVINELMSSNSMGQQDASGAFPDWIELYNDGDEIADLSVLTLTDDPTAPQKWSFPAGTQIPAGGYLLVFADGDPSTPDEVHTSFKLSQDGETLQLVGPAVADFPILDEVQFPFVETDHSWAFISGGFEIDSTPTPGAANE